VQGRKRALLRQELLAQQLHGSCIIAQLARLLCLQLLHLLLHRDGRVLLQGRLLLLIGLPDCLWQLQWLARRGLHLPPPLLLWLRRPCRLLLFWRRLRHQRCFLLALRLPRRLLQQWRRHADCMCRTGCKTAACSSKSVRLPRRRLLQLRLLH
jgi:hypothetical protein